MFRYEFELKMEQVFTENAPDCTKLLLLNKSMGRSPQNHTYDSDVLSAFPSSLDKLMAIAVFTDSTVYYM